MKEYLLYSDKLYAESGCVGGYMKICDGTVTELAAGKPENKEQLPLLDYTGKMVIPGIIDLHMHGYHSWSAKAARKEDIHGLSRILPSIGVTSCLPTTTGWRSHEMEMLSAIADAMDEGCDGANILGIHMEGPFFNPKRHNATPLAEVTPPTTQKLEAYWKAARGKIKYMTIAPEVEGGAEAIAWLTAKGIVPGAGHTDASAEEAKKAVADGIRAAIHTGNAMRGIDRRDVGAMGILLLNPDIYCEIICDLYHLSAEMLEIMFRVKGSFDKFVMMSDSDVLSGVEPGYYMAFGKRVQVCEDGRMLLDDGTIAGSSKYVLYGVQNLVEKLGLPLETVLRLCSLNPAKLLGISDKKGSLAVGKDADIAVLNSDFSAKSAIVGGREVYRAGDGIVLNDNFPNICVKVG